MVVFDRRAFLRVEIDHGIDRFAVEAKLAIAALRRELGAGTVGRDRCVIRAAFTLAEKVTLGDWVLWLSK